MFLYKMIFANLKFDKYLHRQYIIEIAGFTNLMDFGTVPIVWYFLFFYQILVLFRQCGILFFYQILELFRQRGIFCFSIRFWNGSDSVVFYVSLLDFGTVPTVWYFFVFLFDFGTVPTAWYFLLFYQILELFRQCGIFFFLLDFGTVPTVWYFLFFYQILVLFRQCGIFCFSIRFWYCSNSVVFFVFLLDFGTVPTLWYFLFFYQILELFRQRGIFCFSIRFQNCSDSVVFFVFRFINLLQWRIFSQYILIILQNHIMLLVKP